jgi:hypothetical protein
MKSVFGTPFLPSLSEALALRGAARNFLSAEGRKWRKN